MATVGVATNPPASGPTEITQTFQIDVYDNNNGQAYTVTMPCIPRLQDYFKRDAQSQQMQITGVTYVGGGNVLINVN